MRKSLFFLFSIPVVAYILIAIQGVFWVLTTPYELFVNGLLDMIDQQQYRDLIKNEYLSESRFQFLRSSIVAVCVLLLLGVIGFISKTTYRKGFVHFIHRLKATTHRFFNTGISTWLFIILLAHVCKQIYFSMFFSITYDEAWTWTHFSNAHPFLLFFSPNNNHIIYTFYSFLCQFLFDGWLAIRLPVIVISVLFLAMFALLQQQLMGRKYLIPSVLLLICLPAINFYGFLGRGYIFQMIACMVSVGLLIEAMQCEEKDRIPFITLCCLVNAWGLWAVPTHGLFILVECFFVGFINHRKGQGLKQITILIGSALIASLLFLPSWWFLHLPSLFGDSSLSNSTQSTTWWNYINRVSDWLFYGGGRGKVVFPFVLVFLCFQAFLLFKNKSHYQQRLYQGLVLSFLLCISPFILSAFLPVFLPYRIWCFVTPFYVILFIGTVAHYSHLYRMHLVAISLSSIFFMWTSLQHYFIQWSADLDHQAKVISDRMMQEKIDTCYLFSNYDQPLIQYYYQRAKVDLQLYMRSPASQFYVPLSRDFIPPYLIYDREDYKSDSTELSFIHQYYQDTLYNTDRLLLLKRTMHPGK